MGRCLLSVLSFCIFRVVEIVDASWSPWSTTASGVIYTPDPFPDSYFDGSPPAARLVRFVVARVAVARPVRLVRIVSAAFGSTAQMAAASGSGHVPAAVQGPSFSQGNARATPWPTSDTVPGGRVQEVGALSRWQPSGGALPGIPSQLRDSLNQLLHASIAPSSRAHYGRAWHKFVVFTMSLRLPTQLPASVTTMLLFIAHLHAGGNAPSSVVSIVSAIAYFHKANPSKCFIVAKVLAGARNIGSVPDVRRSSLVWC